MPYPPGGPTDIIARLCAQKLSEALGHQFYVENVSGASGARGAAMVAAAPADGQTLLFVTNDLAVTSTISSKLQYDPIKSFAPVGLVSSSPSVVLVHPSVPAKTLQELIQLARADPAKYSFASMLQSFTPSLLPAYAAALLFGYLCGSIPFGLIITRLAGTRDIRSIGSGNIGATNVLRTGRKGLAAATLVGDALKGTFAVLAIYYYYGPEYRYFAHDLAIPAAFGAFLGHLFPVWLGFKGGKGVATYIGILLALACRACTNRRRSTQLRSGRHCQANFRVLRRRQSGQGQIQRGFYHSVQGMKPELQGML